MGRFWRIGLEEQGVVLTEFKERKQRNIVD